MADLGFKRGNPRENQKMTDLGSKRGNPREKQNLADLESDRGNPRKKLKMADQGSGVGVSKKSNNMANQGFCGVKPAETMADEDCLTMTTIAKELMRKNQSIKDFAVPVCLDELRRKDCKTKINKELLENWIENGIKEGLKYYQSIFSGIVTQVCQIIQILRKYISENNNITGNIVPPKRITRDIGMYVDLSHLNPKKKKEKQRKSGKENSITDKQNSMEKKDEQSTDEKRSSSSSQTRASGTSSAPTPMTLNPKETSVKTTNRLSTLLPATHVQGKSTPLPSLSIIPVVTLRESQKSESQECCSPSHPATSNSLIKSELSGPSSTEIVSNLVDTSDIKPLSGLLRDPFQPDECFPDIPNVLVTCPGSLDAEPVINLNIKLEDCEVEEPQTTQIQDSPIFSLPDHTSLLGTRIDSMDCVDRESANLKNIQNIDIQSVLERNLLLMTKNSIKRKGTQIEDVPEAKRVKPADIQTSNKKFSPQRNEERTNSIDSIDDVLPYTKCLRCFQFFKTEDYLTHAQTEHDYNCSGCNYSFPSTGQENAHIILQHRFQCTMQFAKDTQLSVQTESFINAMSNKVLPEESEETVSKASSKLKRKNPRRKEEVNSLKRQSEAKKSSETLNHVLTDHCYIPSIQIKTILGPTSSDTDSVCSMNEYFDKSEQILDEFNICNIQNYVLAQDTEPVMSAGIDESPVLDEILQNEINWSNRMESTISPYFSSSVSQLPRSNTRELSMAMGLSHLPSSQPSIAENKSKMPITDDSLSECNSLLLVSQSSTQMKKPALDPISLSEVISSPTLDLSLQPVDAQLGLSGQTDQAQINISKELDDQALDLSVKQNTAAKVTAPENASSKAAINVKSATVAKDDAANKARANAFINAITTAIGKIGTGAEIVAKLKPVAEANIVEEVNKTAEANKRVEETINEAKIPSKAKTDLESKTRISNREETNPEVKESNEASGYADEIAPESPLVKARIASESVVETEIAFESVFEDKKALDSKVEGKIAPDSVDEGNLDPESEVEAKIDSEPIVEDKIAPESGFEDKITVESVVEGKLNPKSVVDDKIDSEPTDEDTRAPESGVVEAEIAPESRVKTKTFSESRGKTKIVAESRVETKASTEFRVKTRVNSKLISKPKVPTHKEETQKDNTRAKSSLNQPTSSQADKKVKLAKKTLSSKSVSSSALDKKPDLSSSSSGKKPDFSSSSSGKKPDLSSSSSSGKNPTEPVPELSASVASEPNHIQLVWDIKSFNEKTFSKITYFNLKYCKVGEKNKDGQIDLTDFKKTPPIPANGKPSGQCEIGPLGAGHYIFKIRSVDENGGKSKFSERAFFQIK